MNKVNSQFEDRRLWKVHQDVVFHEWAKWHCDTTCFGSDVRSSSHIVVAASCISSKDTIFSIRRVIQSNWFDPQARRYFSVTFPSRTLSLMVICLSTRLQKSCGISRRSLNEKLVITRWFSRKANKAGPAALIWPNKWVEIEVKNKT